MIEKEQPNYELQVEKLARIVEPMVLMIGKLSPLAEYDTLIGDDISARVPALVMRKVINHFRIDKGLPRIKTVFIVGGESLKSEIVSQRNAFFNQNGLGWGRTLYLTEYVEKGSGTEEMVEGLTAAGINFDVAAISIAFNPANSLLPIAQLVNYGEIGHVGAVLHHDARLAGVTKYDNYTAWQMSKLTGWPFGLCARRRQNTTTLFDQGWDEGEIARWRDQTEIPNRLAHAVIDSKSRYAVPEQDKKEDMLVQAREDEAIITDKQDRKNRFIKARKDVGTIADYIIHMLTN